MVNKLKNDIKIKNEKLKEFRKDNKKIISFSMLNTIETCFRQYKFQYVDRIVREKENIYTFLGSLAHSLIEKLYRDEITNEEAVYKWGNELTNCQYYFVNYTRAENVDTRKEMEEKNKLYEENYNKNMVHYFDNFRKMDYIGSIQEEKVHFEISKFFKNDMFKDYIFSGIIDFIGINEDGTLDIIDYKTSTMYKGDKLKLHSYQLILYAICLETIGYKINRIGWNFLKYVRKIRKFKNGNIRVTNVERKDFEEEDSLDFEDCMVYIDYTKENKIQALKYIYDNVFNIIRIDNIKHIDTNKIPYTYSKFFCENLCSFYKMCDISK